MSHPARVVRLGKVAASRELGAVADLMRQVAQARDSGDPWGALVLAELSGDSSALGRYQAGDYAVGPHGAEGWVRRWTGGHSTLYGDGILSVTAVLPDPDCWLEDAGPLPGERIINRYARGAVRGLGAMGLQTAYPGRDFLTVQRKRVAYLSAERDVRGVALFQAVIGLDASYDVEGRPEAAPGQAPLPPPTAISDELDLELFGGNDLASKVLDTLAHGFAAQFRLELKDGTLESPDDADAPALAHPSEDELAQLARGEESPIPIGVLEAFAALDAKGALQRVCFAGEWIAASAGVSALEAALVGVAPESKAVASVVQRFLSAREHFFIGVEEPDPVVAAVLSAAAAARKAG